MYLSFDNFTHSIKWSPDGKFFANGYDNTKLKIKSLYSSLNILILYGHTASINTVYYSPDGKMIASGSRDNTIKLWNT